MSYHDRKITELNEALAASQRREHELTEHLNETMREFESLESRLEAAEKVRDMFSELAESSGMLPHAKQLYRNCALSLSAALTPHPTTNPSEIDSSLVVPQGDSADGKF